MSKPPPESCRPDDIVCMSFQCSLLRGLHDRWLIDTTILLFAPGGVGVTRNRRCHNVGVPRFCPLVRQVSHNSLNRQFVQKFEIPDLNYLLCSRPDDPCAAPGAEWLRLLCVSLRTDKQTISQLRDVRMIPGISCLHKKNNLFCSFRTKLKVLHIYSVFP